MTIGRICQRKVDLADANESIASAVARMKERMVGTLVVVDEERYPTGILTDRDVALRVVAGGLPPKETKVSDVMTAHPRTACETAPIEEALSTMKSLGIRRLLVTDKKGRLAGIVCLDDILSLLIDEFRTMQGILGKTSPSGALV